MSSVKQVSECFIKPHHDPAEAKGSLNMTAWDLAMLSVHYIQKGLLFAKPTPEAPDFMESLLRKLKHSLSLTLVHFYPLAGRFQTLKTDDPPTYSVRVDCRGGRGVKFIHATLDATVSDLLSPTDVPLVFRWFFDHDRAVNHDAHTVSLVSIQVTELVDGVFIGCSMNHALADGTSYWNFWNSWSEIFRAQQTTTTSLTPTISRPPIFDRWFPDGHGPTHNLPYKHPDEFIGRFESPPLRERIFHFSVDSLAKLKARANAEQGTTKISTFQSLSALVWRTVTRVRNLNPDQITSCRLAANNRPRLSPPISEDYFGNVIHPIRGFTAAGELLSHDLGWAAWKIHEAVVSHDDKTVRGLLAAWAEAPSVYRLERLFDPHSVMMGSSPRFDKYGSEFGMGKALALRSGFGNKQDGKVSCYPGREGRGSIDLEVCLSPETMRGVEANADFMEAAGLSPIPL